MGKKHRAYRVWQPEEEEALRLGVQKHGLGAWEQIRTDDSFPSLRTRSGVQLKDKWRNLVKFKHLTQAETACLATKSQKTAWRVDGSMESDGEPDYKSGSGLGGMPPIAVCCQQEIHATLLAREAHNIQIEANKALAAALAAVDRDVEGAEELMRNSVFVATQASEKAMKAKQHVVLARRRLAMVLLAAEKDLVDVGDETRGPEGSSSSPCDRSPSDPEKQDNSPDIHSDCKQSSDTSSDEAAISTLDKAAQSSSPSKVVCSCGSDLTDGVRMYSCQSCGSLAHEGCVVMHATTQGKTFDGTYVCKSCVRSKQDDEAAEHVGQADSAALSSDTGMPDLTPLKRKPTAEHSQIGSTDQTSPQKRLCSSGPEAETPTSRLGLLGSLGKNLARKIQSLHANLEASPFNMHMAGLTAQDHPQSAGGLPLGGHYQANNASTCASPACSIDSMPDGHHRHLQHRLSANQQQLLPPTCMGGGACASRDQTSSILDQVVQDVSELSGIQLPW
mmetsp:Transcript_12072/g.33932  ORF Transcript_12072/g.33932 Transcript_12072/m.33932 type:complete len:504 (+) Transcript_12072:504-2015(+)|eukprot:CAMPEP_0117681362 /NCGR_PEP_ID=MMETSP0804-20121206/18935_1 /TAXON_ID=1074897 /ORGANISM="Tetraselmis astigmatica, Strain CCMP880" /LENGTH=503 /DNA_ID=CAMNT_0005491101 /DNA_START=496 /DNA_END=2007 /DNA_ORIENTATION=+